MKKSTFVKIVLGTVLTIILGAIGSGLWERAIGPGFDAVANFVINAISRLVGTYKDSIYADVAKGFHEQSSMFLHILVLSLLPMGYMIILIRHPIRRKKPGENNRIRKFVRSQRGYYMLIVITLSIMLTFFLSQFRVTYINKVITFSEQSMHILAPYVSNDEMKDLRATYHLVQNRDDYFAFHKRLLKMSKEAGVKLPKFKPL